MKAKRWAVLSGLFMMILVLAAACSSGIDAEPASPAAVAASIDAAQDEAYYAELAAAQALTRANFTNFGKIFSSSWPIRSALISALLDAGVGNAFFDGLEALKQIAFHSLRDGNREIYVMDADGGNQTRITFDPALNFTPVWSPNGKQFVFTSQRDSMHEIYVMNADGSNITRLTFNSVTDRDPKWSAHRKWVA
jgi:dipeptidyl aminopeptidase/acylaminoacyl peptidase